MEAMLADLPVMESALNTSQHLCSSRGSRESTPTARTLSAAPSIESGDMQGPSTADGTEALSTATAGPECVATRLERTGPPQRVGTVQRRVAMTEISAVYDLDGSEAGEALHIARASSSGEGSVERQGDVDRSGGGGAFLKTPLAPLPTAKSVDAPALAPLQSRSRAEIPPYEPVLRLSTERYKLHGVRPADIAPDCLARLEEALWVYTARHLVGACVRLGHDASCHIVLDTADVLDSPGTGIGGALSMGARRGSRAASSERRRAAGGGGAIWDSWLGAWLWQVDTDVEPDGELGVSRLRAALTRRSWLRPRDWAQRAWSAVVRASRSFAAAEGVLWTIPIIMSSSRSRVSRRGGSPGRSSWRRRQTEARNFEATSGWEAFGGDTVGASVHASHGSVIASRITSVAPRVLMVDRSWDGPWNPLPAGTAPHRQLLPGSAESTACVHVTATVCCARPRPSDFTDAKARLCRSNQPAGQAGGRDGGSRCSATMCARCVPSLEVMMRHGHGFAFACKLLAEGDGGDAQDAAPGPSAPQKSRTQCRQKQQQQQHRQLPDVRMQQDIRLADCIEQESSADARWTLRLGPGAGILGPGLLLLDLRTAPTEQRASTQRPVPVVLVEDPWVAEELQDALMNKQVATCSSGNCDDLLVDLGVFLQQVAVLRHAAGPVLAHAEAGQLRHGRMPPCCCYLQRASEASTGAVPGANAGAPITPSDATAGSRQATSSPASVCVACALQQLQGLLQQYLSTHLTLSLGESLLRHATASGWARTASHISRGMVDLQRIDMLVGAVLGQSGKEQLTGGVRICCNSGSRCRPASTQPASLLPSLGQVRSLIRACLRTTRPADLNSAAATGTPMLLRTYLEFGAQSLLGRLRRRTDLLGDLGVVVLVLLAAMGLRILSLLVMHALAHLAAQHGVAPPEWRGALPLSFLSTCVTIATAAVLLTYICHWRHEQDLYQERVMPTRL